MMVYWVRLARPGWLIGASGAAVGLVAASTALGWADFFGRSDFADLIREKGGAK